VSSELRREREDAFRADVARLIQVMRHHLRARDVLPEIASLREPVRHLASLLDAADAPNEYLQDAAMIVVEAYDWPIPDAIDSDESPVIDVAVLAAVERLREAMNAMDEATDDI
jgi:nitrate reductase beta subunit